MKFSRFVRKNWLAILVVVVVVAVVYNYSTKEGFKAGDMLKETDCINRGKTPEGSYTWANGKCYAPCGVGVKMRGNANKCGPLDDRFTDDPKRYTKGTPEYNRFYKPGLFTARPIARY